MPKKVVNRFPDVQVGDLVRVKRGSNKDSVGVVVWTHHNPKMRINPYASLCDGNMYTLTNLELLSRNGSKA